MTDAELILVYGNDPGRMVRQALDASDLDRLVPEGGLVALKPNLVVSRPASSGATTHPEIVEATIGYLKEKGFHRLVIMEGSWVGDSTGRAFAAAGYEALSRRTGVPLVDLQDDSWKLYDAGDGVRIAVCDTVMAADFIIGIPVIKGHCQTRITCALKNMKGCIPDEEKRRFHEEGLHEPIARLNRVRKTDFVIADGICGDLDFEEGGNPVTMNRILVARDPVLADAFACRLMGHDVRDVPYIGLAGEYGVGSADLSRMDLIELGDKESAPAIPPRSGKLRRLATRIDERSACSACHAALIHGLARIDESGLLGEIDRVLQDCGGRIAVGREFRGGTVEGFGCGVCTKGAKAWVGGCPPDGLDVATFLTGLL